MYRCWKARKVVRARVSEVYRKMFDASSGYPYYFNTLTSASTWTKPLGAVLREDDLEMTPRTMAAMLQVGGGCPCMHTHFSHTRVPPFVPRG